MKSLTLLAAVSALSACSSWAPPGRGGFAEHHIGSFLPTESHQSYTSYQALRLDWESQKQKLTLLRMQGADLCFPATVQQETVRQNRVARELMGELFGDASVNLLILRENLAELERKLLLAKKGGACDPGDMLAHSKVSDGETPSFNDSTASTLDYLNELLNADNQFALDSDALNPKYQQRLEKAAEILQEHDQLTLLISGHTDFQGNENYNHGLSAQRAKNVKAYLESQGLASDRFYIIAAGEHVDLFAGTAPEVNLVNRRVAIKVLSNHYYRQEKLIGDTESTVQ